MAKVCRFTVLFLSVACALALAVPRVTTVSPDAAAPGGSAVAEGSDLAEGSVAKIYLTAGGSDIELTITEQTAEAIKFEIPDGTDMKRYRIMVLTAGAGAAYMEQPVAIEIVDEETAKQRAEEGEVELEIIEAEPEEEEEQEGGRRRRRNN